MAGKRYIVRLIGDERASLIRVVKAEKGVSAKKRVRAQILLKVDQGEDGPGWTDEQVAKALDVHLNTVQSVRRRFVTEGLEVALSRKKQARPSRVRMFDESRERILLATAQGDPPSGQARWTLHLLADQMVELEIVESVSHETIRKVLKKTLSIRSDRWRG